MHRNHRSLLALLLLPLMLLLTAATPPRAGTGAPLIAFEKYTLPNGLQVILHVDRKLPIVHVNQWYHVGSKNEKPGRTGFAHLFEHLMFQGAKHTPGEYFAYAEVAGANLNEGGVNGTTSNDRTNYFATVPSANLEYLLWLESDRLATLGDALTKEKLNNQREVVRNERRQSLENQPYGRAFKLLVENLYPAGHPYSWPVIGSHEDLQAASLEDVQQFFRTFYTPNNLSLVIAGDFDPAEARRLVEKYFGGIAAGPALDRPGRWVPALSGERIVEVRDRVAQERVYLAWPAPPYFEAGEAELNLASTILADGVSSRLQKALIFDRQLASEVEAFHWGKEIAGVYVVMATARQGVPLAQIEAIVTAEIARLAKDGPTAQELSRARAKIEFQFVSGLERIGGFGGKADLLNSYNVFLGDPGKFEEDLARYRAITTAGVKDAVARWIDTPNRLSLRFRPEVSGRPTADVDRSRQPAMGADRPFQAPAVETARLENGLEILVARRPDLPKVAVTLATRAGSVHDPADKAGLALLTARIMRRGTPSRSAQQVDDALGDLGTAIVPFASREAAGQSLEVLKANLAPAMAVFAEVVTRPTYPQAEVDRELKLQLDNLAQQARNANSVASRVASMLAFGPEHPYGRPTQGLPATVQRITRADLAGFHQAQWRPGSAALIFAGDITLAEATELARRHLAGWSGGAAPAAVIPPPQPAEPGRVYLVDRQDAAQTAVMQILPGPRRQSDDYYALKVADTIWGGAFGSRLNLNLREDKGYSYGVFSTPRLFTAAGAWLASGGVQTDKTRESVVEFVNELQALAGKKPITDKELTDARSNLIRGYAQGFETLGQLTSQIADLWAMGLPLAELQREPEELARIQRAAVQAVLSKYAVPQRAALLLVGDRDKIEPGIRSLKLGELVILDAEGRPVAK